MIWERTQHPEYTRHVPLKTVCELDGTADTGPVFGLAQLCLGVCGARLPDHSALPLPTSPCSPGSPGLLSTHPLSAGQKTERPELNLVSGTHKLIIVHFTLHPFKARWGSGGTHIQAFEQACMKSNQSLNSLSLWLPKVMG